jgi:hypothetical protein
MKKYRIWEIVEIMPQGWGICIYVGSPLAGHVFITNGKSPLKGEERKLLKIPQHESKFKTILE